MRIWGFSITFLPQKGVIIWARAGNQGVKCICLSGDDFDVA